MQERYIYIYIYKFENNKYSLINKLTSPNDNKFFDYFGKGLALSNNNQLLVYDSQKVRIYQIDDDVVTHLDETISVKYSAEIYSDGKTILINQGDSIDVYEFN